MLKKLTTMILAVAMALSMSICALAGQWIGDDESGWGWMKDDGTYAISEWTWIDDNNDGIDECYYFDGNGLLITGPITPIFFGCSGSGWETIFYLYPDGSFTGEYSVKINQDLPPEYREWVDYTFAGDFINFQQVDDYTYTMELGTIETIPAGGDVYGLDGTTFTLYLPGADLGDKDDYFTRWIRYDAESLRSIPVYCISNGKTTVNNVVFTSKED